MSTEKGLTPEELSAESAVALPDKEVVSILDLNADVDLAIDAAAPIDLAAAANLNIAAPIDAAAGANVLSFGSGAQALGEQGVLLNQSIAADANADATQVSGIDQSNDTIDGDTALAGATAETTDGTASADASLVDDLGGTVDPATTTDGVTDTVGGVTDGVTDGTTGDAVGGAVGGVTDGLGGTVDGATGTIDSTTGALADGNLLNGNVNVVLDTDSAAPINGAVAANANVAAPINAGVSANIGTIDSVAVADANQQAIINQSITGEANATADQDSDITQ